MGKIKNWSVEWRKNETTRYYGIGGRQIQVGHYREADDFDKTVGNKADWHGKWYVDSTGYAR